MHEQPKPTEVKHQVVKLPNYRQQSEWSLIVCTAMITAVIARGALVCLLSAAAFGAMGVFGKLAFDDGATAGTLLAARFVIAAVALWCLMLIKGSCSQIRAVAPRDLAIAVGLGACG